MAGRFYSVDEVAELLGLHVKTVRNHVREGRLKAVRAGRRYRISREALAEFLGHPPPEPARETVRRSRRTGVTSVVEIEAISPAAMSRLSSLLTAVRKAPPDGEPLHVQIVYAEERAEMKIILTGGMEATAEALRLAAALAREL